MRRSGNAPNAQSEASTARALTGRSKTAWRKRLSEISLRQGEQARIPRQNGNEGTLQAAARADVVSIRRQVAVPHNQAACSKIVSGGGMRQLDHNQKLVTGDNAGDQHRHH